MLEPLLIAILGLYVTVSLVLVLVSRRLLGQLTEHYRSKWEELGSPTALPSTTTSVKSVVTFNRFLLRNEYLALEDRRINSIARSAKYLTVVSFALAGFVVLLLFFGNALGL